MTFASDFALLRRAEAAWVHGDLNTSTATLAQHAGNPTPVVHEAAYQPEHMPAGTSSIQLSHGDKKLSSHLTTFGEGIAIFDIGVPLTLNGTFFSQTFSHLRYPERYTHLFTTDTDRAIKTIREQPNRLENAYIVPIRPPYYHWLLDTVPHLLGAGRLSHLPEVRLIAPNSMPLRSWQKELLEKSSRAFGATNLKWTPLDGNIIGVRPGYSQTRLPLTERLTVLRALMPRYDSAPPWRFIYVKRSAGDVRQLLNEAALLEALSDRFEVIEPGQLDIEFQMKVFAEARCVVGVHGSNLTNIVFCQPGTAVVEIAAGLPQPHFENLCKGAGLNFARVNGMPAHERDSAESDNAMPATWAQAHGDLGVDAKEVLQAIEQALAV